MLDLSLRLLGFTAAAEINAAFISLRLCRFEFFAQRETARATFKVSRMVAGEVTIDLPWASICLVNHRRVDQHFAA